MEVSCFGQKIHKNSWQIISIGFFNTFFVSKKEKFTQVWKNMRVRVIDKILEHFVSVNVLFMYFPVYHLNHLDDLSKFLVTWPGFLQHWQAVARQSCRKISWDTKLVVCSSLLCIQNVWHEPFCSTGANPEQKSHCFHSDQGTTTYKTYPHGRSWCRTVAEILRPKKCIHPSII